MRCRIRQIVNIVIAVTVFAAWLWMTFGRAVSVMLTFTTIMAFLGPLYGYGKMFRGANLFYHLLIPITAFAETVFLSEREYTLRDNNIAVIPTLLYGVYYISNCVCNGQENGDWYWFLAWGYPVGILIFIGICIVTWLLAFVMRKLQKRIREVRYINGELR